MQTLTFMRLCLGVFFAICLLASAVQTTPVQQDLASPDKTLQTRGKIIDGVKKLWVRRKGKQGRCSGSDECADSGHQGHRPVTPQASTTHLEQLWNSISDSKKVKTGAFKAWKLDTNRPERFAPSEFMGCTIVAIVDGTGVSIGHIPEENNRCTILEDKAKVQKEVIEKMGNAITPEYDLSDQSVAYILFKPPNRNQNPGLQALVDGLVDQGMNRNNIHTQPYSAAGGALASTQGSRGKLVVDWTKRDGGGNHIALYMQSDQPAYERDYDEHGNPCTLNV